MTSFTDSFCWRPFTDIVFAGNFYKPCCYYTKNLVYKSFDEVNKEIRNDIKENRWNSGCDVCRKTELDGNTNSHRFNYKGTKNANLFEQNKFELTNLEIKVDNNCNIACITCGSHSSSRWSVENKKMYNVNDSTQHSVNLENLFNSNLWNNVKTLTLYGGEPLYSKRVYKILRYAVENQFSKNIHLEFYTNGTVLDTEIISLLQNFKQVSIGFSIDATYGRFNIIRWPAKWDEVVKNYNKIKKLSNVDTYKIYTYSLLNACFTKNDLRILDETMVGYTVPNLLINPSYYAARHLPYDVKQKLLEEIYNIPNFASLHSELLQDGDESQLMNALTKLKHLDSFRNTDSSILFTSNVW